MTDESIVYFEDTAEWEQNTQACVDIVKQYLSRDPIEFLVVASSSGRTAAQFARALDLTNVRVIGVKMAAAIDAKYNVSPDAEACAYLKTAGVPFVGGVHALTGGVDAALAEQLHSVAPTELVAHTLYLFSQGMKVAVEVALMAHDHGLVPDYARVLACAGTSYGTDTVILVKAAASSRLFDLRVLKILAKPLEG